MHRIYLDHAASTPVDPRVIQEMSMALTDLHGNASSLHSDGVQAKQALEQSRSTLASILSCDPEELVFTSGGTESNNLALKGCAMASRGMKNHLIVSSTEHECILNTCRWLHELGFRITYLPVDTEGMVDPEAVRKSASGDTLLVSVMHVNNETGAIQPLQEIGKITREQGILFHTDACQSFGKIALHPYEIPADLVTINSHKIGGPKGVGALFVRKGVRLEPLLHGGGQERGIRSTTENVPGIVGFAKAAALCQEQAAVEYSRLAGLRYYLEDRLTSTFENVCFNGARHAVPWILNFSFQGLEGEAIRLLLLLDEEGISVSTGSACSANHGDQTGSHVLKAMGRNPVEARGGIRVSFGRTTTAIDLEIFFNTLQKAIRQLKPIFSF